MAANMHRDLAKPTHHWTIGADGDEAVGLDAWWNRGPKRYDEKFVIRQENNEHRADVIELTLGQVYDLIDALNKAVENG